MFSKSFFILYGSYYHLGYIWFSKSITENNFLIFGFTMKNMKENQIQLKLIKKLYILKLFNLYMIKENK